MSSGTEARYPGGMSYCCWWCWPSDDLQCHSGTLHQSTMSSDSDDSNLASSLTAMQPSLLLGRIAMRSIRFALLLGYWRNSVSRYTRSLSCSYLFHSAIPLLLHFPYPPSRPPIPLLLPAPNNHVAPLFLISASDPTSTSPLLR